MRRIEGFTAEAQVREIGLAILDLKLPDSNDLGLLRQIRKLAPNCRR